LLTKNPKEAKMKRNIALLVVMVFTCAVISLIVLNNPVYAQKVRIVSGKVTAIYPVFGSKGSLTISSNKKIYTIYTGVKTNFHPPRWPVVGDWVRVRYIIDRKGYYRAYDIYID
jgi:hypothetical protein